MQFSPAIGSASCLAMDQDGKRVEQSTAESSVALTPVIIGDSVDAWSVWPKVWEARRNSAQRSGTTCAQRQPGEHSFVNHRWGRRNGRIHCGKRVEQSTAKCSVVLPARKWLPTGQRCRWVAGRYTLADETIFGVSVALEPALEKPHPAVTIARE